MKKKLRKTVKKKTNTVVLYEGCGCSSPYPFLCFCTMYPNICS